MIQKLIFYYDFKKVNILPCPDRWKWRLQCSALWGRWHISEPCQWCPPQYCPEHHNKRKLPHHTSHLWLQGLPTGTSIELKQLFQRFPACTIIKTVLLPISHRCQEFCRSSSAASGHPGLFLDYGWRKGKSLLHPPSPVTLWQLLWFRYPSSSASPTLLDPTEYKCSRGSHTRSIRGSKLVNRPQT